VIVLTARGLWHADKANASHLRMISAQTHFDFIAKDRNGGGQDRPSQIAR
jgi:hypothetical protein